MGKKSASKDRGYVTATEWKVDGGGWKDKTAGLPFRRLPFNCCAISFVPFDDPVCAADGTVMDIMHAVPYVQKHGKHPVTGEPLALKDLTKLTFHKNADGEYECPVLNKTFTDSTHIVAVRTTGHVYCNQAIEELCAKPKNWRDLLTDEKFSRKDLVTIQDPMNLAGRAVDRFEHVVRGHDVAPARAPSAAGNVNAENVSADVKRVLAKLGTDEALGALESGGGGRKAQAERALAEAKAAAADPSSAGSKHPAESRARASSGLSGADKSHLLRGPSPASHPLDNVRFRPGSHTWNTDGAEAHDAASDAARRREEVEGRAAERRGLFETFVGSPALAKYRATKRVNEMRTTGAGSTSFTSTVMGHATANARTEEAVFLNPKKKGYVRVSTTHGDLNLELHCDVAPRTCETFLTLCASGYYDGVEFHRSIKNFMIQGGDPSGSGRGGECVWGGKFKDEITHLTHAGRGVVAMANSGPNTNGSQFYVLYKSARHLDGKHAVFGNVVGGMDTLARMERVETDDEDRPKTPVKILGAEVFVDPYDDLAKETEANELKKAETEAKALREREEAMNPGRWWSNPAGEAAREAGERAGAGDAKSGVGKYVAAAREGHPRRDAEGSKRARSGENDEARTKRAKPGGGGYGNFDAW